MTERTNTSHDAVAYLLAYIIPLLVIASVWLGRLSGERDLFALAPMAIAYLFLPLYQAWRPHQSAPLGEAAAGWQRWFRWLPLFAIIPELAMLYVAAGEWAEGGLAWWARLALVFGTGWYSTLFGVNFAHALMHHREPFDRFMSGFLLSAMCFGSFRIVHLQIHHPHVGTPADFASPPRGRGFYRYWVGCFAGNFLAPIKLERARLAKTAAAPWRSELVLWTLLSLAWLGISIALFGAAGGVFFLLQSLFAIMQLDLVNYIQHYGLERRRLAGGGFEPVGTRHAWCQTLWLDDLLLLNLPRHAEHHVHPQIPFERLAVSPDAPRYPYSYAVMILLALAPPLFRRVVDPCLDRIAGATEAALRPATS